MPRPCQPEIEVIARRCGVQIFAEQPFQLACRQVCHPRDIGLGQRLFQIVLHGLDHRQKLGMADAKARAELHPLPVGGLADSVMDELVRHFRGQRAAMRLRNQVEHHVERGGATGAGDTCAINFKQVIGDVELGKFLGKPVDILPVDRAAPAVKKAGSRHHIGTGADGTDHRAVAVKPPHQIENISVGIFTNIDAGADKHHAAVLQHRRVAMRGHLDAVAGGRGIASRAGDHPFIEILVALPVCRAKRFDRRSEGQHREIIEEQESDSLR